ncbi:hypothetical protein FPQ18DRAFT_384421 [Pyronema domesticum]|nr:hypothetical protein FPQ18DRAFT_384421 [Pyronema domesticum]
MDKSAIFKSSTSSWVDLQRAARKTWKGLSNDEDGRLAYHEYKLQESRMEAREEK